MSEFKLIDKWLGLEIIPGQEYMHPGYDGKVRVVAADALEAKLAEGRIKQFGPRSVGWHDWTDKADHEALLIGVRPIQKDTAEGLLREYIGRLDAADWAQWESSAQIIEFNKRAKAILSKD